MTTQQPNTLENPNIVDIKSVTIEHPKTSRKLSKAREPAKNVSLVSGSDKNSDSTLYSKTKKSENLLNTKNCQNNETISCL